MTETIDLARIGKEAGVPTREVAGPFGEVMYDQDWSKPCLPKVFDLIRERLEPGPVPMTGHTDPWVFLAIVYALDLEERFAFAVPSGTHRLVPLARGPEPGVNVVFKVLEEGDRVFVYFDTDPDQPENKVFPAPGAQDGPPDMTDFQPQEHSFDAADIPKIVVPEIPTGKHVYFYGDGIFPAHLAVAHELGKGQKSLWVACHGKDYACVFCRDGSAEAGDLYPRREF